MKKIGISTGDPAGIGPEITTKAMQFIELGSNFIYIIYGIYEPFKTGNNVIEINDPVQAVSSEKVYFIKIDTEVEIGFPSEKSGEVSYNILQRCADDLNSQKLDAIVTCPISKEAIHHKHPEFIGHTEFFANSSHTENVIMSFWGPHFNLALLTTHFALKDVCDNLPRNVVTQKLKMIYKECSAIIEAPKFAMLAINPHAGENGAFGNEDIMINSILDELSSQNMHIDGPFPADTFFASAAAEYDIIISAYHDQGLIPFKMLSSEEGVNATLGLPFVRTSVDHGTAYDIAGKNIASEKSLLKAIHYAEKLLMKQSDSPLEQYSIFADYYDEYMKHVPYEEWTEFILAKYNKFHRCKPLKVLELACGTANISTRLVRKGINVEAVDSSRNMLKIAAEKPFSPQLFNKKITDTFPKNNYDLILLIFDSINYLLKKKDIKILLNNVNNSLIKDGLFIFDLTTKKNCMHNFDGFLNIVDTPQNYVIHQSDYFMEDNIHQTHFTFFQKKGFLFSRKDEIHDQRIYKVSEIMKLILESGLILESINSIGNETNLIKKDPKMLDSNFNRLFFTLKK